MCTCNCSGVNADDLCRAPFRLPTYPNPLAQSLDGMAFLPPEFAPGVDVRHAGACMIKKGGDDDPRHLDLFEVGGEGAPEVMEAPGLEVRQGFIDALLCLGEAGDGYVSALRREHVCAFFG